MSDVVDGLINDVHENGWEVGDYKDVRDLPPQDQHQLHCPGGGSLHGAGEQMPARQDVLVDKRGTKIIYRIWCEMCGHICRA